MGLLLFFKRKGVVTGELVIRGLPPEAIFSVSIAYIAVESVPPWLPINPSLGLWRDSEPIKELDESGDRPIWFKSLPHPPGYYFLGVHVTAHLVSKDRIVDSQSERFFPMDRPCHIRRGFAERVELGVTWQNSLSDQESR
jgi:hypothetical protein